MLSATSCWPPSEASARWILSCGSTIPANQKLIYVTGRNTDESVSSERVTFDRDSLRHSVHGKNDFADGSKILPDTDLKTILLDHQNNFVETLKIMRNVAKNFSN